MNTKMNTKMNSKINTNSINSTTSLDEEEQRIIELKDNLDYFIANVSRDVTPRQKVYLERIHRIIDLLETNIDEFVTDVAVSNFTQNTRTQNKLPQTMIDEVKGYVINEKIKEKFMPYMLLYQLYLNQLFSFD
tara:strand:+ start:715 stop:1113 length:399 start_codon:yes stop_codon:yes gene_type:complete